MILSVNQKEKGKLVSERLAPGVAGLGRGGPIRAIAACVCLTASGVRCLSGAVLTDGRSAGGRIGGRGQYIDRYIDAEALAGST